MKLVAKTKKGGVPGGQFMVETENLSPSTLKAISLVVAVRSNAVIEFDYFGISGEAPERKIVRPHSVFEYHGSLYLFGSYDEKNGKDVGAGRSFALTGIGPDIRAVEYVRIEKERFRSDGRHTPYGKVKDDEFVIVRISGVAAKYFKREKLSRFPDMEFIKEEGDGSLLVKKYYLNTLDLSVLIKSWMPDIKIVGGPFSFVKEEVMGSLKDSFESFFAS